MEQAVERQTSTDPAEASKLWGMTRGLNRSAKRRLMVTHKVTEMSLMKPTTRMEMENSILYS